MKREQLENEKKRIEKALRRLEERMQKSERVEEFAEKLKTGIEKRRKTILRDIQWQALNIYNTLTNQHVYKAFRINPDTYEVYVQAAKPRNSSSQA